MRKSAVASVFALAALVASFGLGSGAQAATGSVLYVVHALDATGDGPGSSNVTVCVDGASISNDFSYSQMLGPLNVTTAAHTVKVFVGTSQDCAGASPLIDQTVTPSVGTYVAAAWYDTAAKSPAIAVNQIDDACVPAGTARLGAGHFAQAGPVKVLVDGAPSTIGDLEPGQLQTNGQTAGSHAVKVELVSDSSTVFDFGNVSFTNPVLSIGFVTGGYDELIYSTEFPSPTPIRGFAQAITLTTCSTTTTSSSTTTSTIATTTTVRAVTVTPRFTG